MNTLEIAADRKFRVECMGGNLFAFRKDSATHHALVTLNDFDGGINGSPDDEWMITIYRNEDNEEIMGACGGLTLEDALAGASADLETLA
tara:strand:- start:3316 stop:3585 length:270 start_codon:yes stop_codon:yes gene_type:complete